MALSVNVDFKRFSQKITAAVKKGQSFFAYIGLFDDEYEMQVIDTIKHEIVWEYKCTDLELVSTLKSLPCPHSFKTIVFNIFNEMSTHAAMLNAFKLKQELDVVNIPTYFGSNAWWFFSRKLPMISEDLSTGDVVIVAKLNPGLTLLQFMFDENGFQFINLLDAAQTNEELVDLDEKILEMNDHIPKLVAIWTQNDDNNLKQVFIQKYQYLKIVDAGNVSLPTFINRICKHISTGGDEKQWMQPFSVKQVQVSSTLGSVNFHKILIDFYEILPTQKAFVFLRTCGNVKVELCYRRREDTQFRDSELVKTCITSRDCHRNQVIVSVDKNNFLNVIHQRMFLKEVIDLPGYVTAFADINLGDPVIALFDMSSVILIPKKNIYEETLYYEFSEQWNGAIGKDLLVAFNKEKPIFFEEAFATFKKKPSYVVYDLVKLMARDPDEIIDKDTDFWSFKVTSSVEYNMLLEVDCFGGRRKYQTPEFFFALLIKKHLKAIETEMGQKPKNLAFITMDPFTSEETVRVRDKINEACNLIKINGYFFDVE